jgi:hypothetical protein
MLWAQALSVAGQKKGRKAVGLTNLREASLVLPSPALGNSRSQWRDDKPDGNGDKHGLGVGYSMYADIWRDDAPENHGKPGTEEKANTSSRNDEERQATH